MKKILVMVLAVALAGLTGWLYFLVVKVDKAPLVPSRAAMEGFEWKEISAHGMRLLVQDNGVMSLVAMADGFAIKREDGVALRPEIELLKKGWKETPEELIESQFIGALIPEVQSVCEVVEYDAKKFGVRRFVIRPNSEEYVRKMEQLAGNITEVQPCGAYGVRNGIQYFEYHKKRPGQLLFVRVGQDAPMFDEQSLRVN